jgi:hypothetical protein
MDFPSNGSHPDGFPIEWLSSTVGTPGLGVRQPEGKSAGGKISRRENQPEGKSAGGKIASVDPMRVADAQTGRAYSNNFPLPMGQSPD